MAAAREVTGMGSRDEPGYDVAGCQLIPTRAETQGGADQMDEAERPAGLLRDANGRFAPGGSGRPRGTRNRVSAQAAREILADFRENKGEVLPRSRRWFLPQYLSLIGRLLPRQEGGAGLDLDALAHEDVLALIARFRAAADRYEAGEGGVDELEAALTGEG